jgi:hypothetical protein
MKRFFLLFILLFTAMVQAATTPEVETGSVSQPEKDRPVPHVEQKTGKQHKQDQQWPQPFVPSEQIGADSVVSFPADI